MSKIDEQTINAHLKQREPLPLPWSKDGERRASEAEAMEDSESRIFESSKRVGGYSPHQTVKMSSILVVKDHYLENKYQDENPNVQLSNRRITSSLLKSSHVKIQDEEREKDQGYKPYNREDNLSRSNRMPEGREGRAQKYSDYNSIEKRTQVANPLATRSDTKAQGIPVKTKKSPRCTGKVSRHIIQESKLGYPIPLVSEKCKSGICENSLKSCGALLKQENVCEYKVLKAVEEKSNQTMNKRKAIDDALTDENRIESIELNGDTMRLNDSKARYKARDREIDTELDNLLDITSEAMQYPLNIVKNVLPGDDLTNAKYDERKQNQRTRKVYKENCSTSSDDKNMHEHVKVKQEKGPVVISKSENDDYDVSSQDMSEQSQRVNKQEVKADATENMDEILKFTFQMMEIKQPKLMSRKKHSQNSAPAKQIENMRKPVEKESIKNDTDKIDYEKVEELNRKSQELFRKVIQNRKKKFKKHTTLMNLDPESDRRRIRKQKERANKLRIHEELAADARENTNFYKDEQIVDDKEDDVFDISPAQNRASFSDSEPDNSNSLEHDYDDNKDSIEKNTLNETHRLKPAKSYTILKHDRNTSIKDMTVRSKSILKGEQAKERRSKFCMAKGDNCDKNENVQNDLNVANFENDTRGKQKGTYLDKHRIVNEKNKEKVMNEFSEKENEMHDDTKNENILLNILAIGTDKVVKIENNSKDSRPEIELGDLMYDSDTDTFVDSDYNSDQDFFSRPSTAESRDTDAEFPRPASNRTFVLSNNETNFSISNQEYAYDETAMETDINDNELVDKKEEKKFSKLQRFLNWITCCVRPKSDN